MICETWKRARSTLDRWCVFLHLIFRNLRCKFIFRAGIRVDFPGCHRPLPARQWDSGSLLPVPPNNTDIDKPLPGKAQFPVDFINFENQIIPCLLKCTTKSCIL